jgi:putative membrane protein
MTLRWAIAVLHLLALGVGLGAIFARSRALKFVQHQPRLRTIFLADNLWGVAGLLWIGTGIWRAFGGLEKGTEYYLGEPLFHAKLGLVGLLIVLEIWPMITLIQWRLGARRGQPVSLVRAQGIARISYVQTLIVIVILVLAVGIAGG